MVQLDRLLLFYISKLTKKKKRTRKPELTDLTTAAGLLHPSAEHCKSKNSSTRRRQFEELENNNPDIELQTPSCFSSKVDHPIQYNTIQQVCVAQFLISKPKLE